MKHVMLAGLVVGVLALGTSFTTVQASDYGTISVEGHAMETYTDNEAVVTVNNHVEKSTVAEAKVENDRIAQAFRADLDALGIPQKDIKTVDYTIRERKTYNASTKDYDTTYVVTNVLKITVTDSTKTSQVFDKAAANGITDVQLSKMDLNDQQKEAQHQKLLIAAAKDARQKADALAAALGTHVTGVESFNEEGNYGRNRLAMPMTMAFDSKVAVNNSHSTIEYGEDKAETNVNVVFKVK